ncbi:hypothetical protein GGQ97_000703 [Sphingomonas kaistensis]|uniref:DUF2927 domain-containing protein n=1 Tax=Sphingomonas kaistensis TaxID=298708 RepID=A0A7X6BFY9_9SPHN|nr:hypothetical protein [Sphingomonas kaistensis]NJC04910.1 hypothetical protein [Sphingomonas kaistensis]
MKNRLACAVLLALSGIGSANVAPPPPSTTPSAGDADIIVRGKREREAEIKGFIDALAPSRFSGQLARFSTEACPGVLGLVPAQSAAVVARLRRIGEAVGVPLAKAGCKPNVWLVVTTDRAALAAKVRGSWKSGPDGRPDPGRSTDLATVLHAERLLDANRQEIGVKVDAGDGDGGYYQSEIFTSNRIRPSATRTYAASALIVEPRTLEGLTTLQLADYAAMRLFARADPARLGPAAPPSILAALAAPVGSELPESVTQWDVAFLKALYRSDDRSYANAQKDEMQSIIRKEITGQDKAPKPRR